MNKNQIPVQFLSGTWAKASVPVYSQSRSGVSTLPVTRTASGRNTTVVIVGDEGCCELASQSIGQDGSNVVRTDNWDEALMVILSQTVDKVISAAPVPESARKLLARREIESIDLQLFLALALSATS